MYEFHEVVDHMQEEEEGVIDAHRELMEVISSPDLTVIEPSINK